MDNVTVSEALCWGLTTRFGTKIIAWLTLIGSLMFMVTTCLMISKDDWMTPSYPRETSKLVDRIVLYSSFVLLAFTITCATHSALLLYGVYKSKRKVVYSWITAIPSMLMILFLMVVLYIFLVAISVVEYGFRLPSILSGVLYGFGLYLNPVVMRFLDELHLQKQYKQMRAASEEQHNMIRADTPPIEVKSG